MGGGGEIGFRSDIFDDCTQESKWCGDNMQCCDLLDNNLIANTPLVKKKKKKKK